jgi:hypothetical protein
VEEYFPFDRVTGSSLRNAEELVTITARYPVPPVSYTILQKIQGNRIICGMNARISLKN